MIPAQPPADSAAHGLSKAALPPFFAVSLRKLAILSVCMLGLYHLYWFYCHWRRIGAWSDASGFSPARRTLFFVFYCYPLFRRVRMLDARVNGRSRLHAAWLASGYVAANLLDLLPDPFGWLSLFSFVFLLHVQACANRLNEQLCAAPFDRNERLRGWNWAAVALGAVALVLGLAAAVSVMGR